MSDGCQFEQKSFSVSSRGRSPSVCEANGKHAEPDRMGRCFMCGTPLPPPKPER